MIGAIPDMLVTRPIEQVTGGLPRQWMADDYFDLIVWYEPDGRVHGFQLCYDKPGRERALTWTLTDGFRHGRIDIGEYDPRANRTPVLQPEGSFSADVVRAQFLTQSAELSEAVRVLVLAKIDEFGAQGGGGETISAVETPAPGASPAPDAGDKPDRLPPLSKDAEEPRPEWMRLAVSLLVAVLIVGAVAILLSVSFQREALRYFFGR